MRGVLSCCQPARTEELPLSMMMAVFEEVLEYVEVSVGSWPW
jgi:hypothetical protein